MHRITHLSMQRHGDWNDMLHISMHRITHLSMQRLHVVCLGKYVRPHRARNETAFQHLFYEKTDFGHG